MQFIDEYIAERSLRKTSSGIGFNSYTLIWDNKPLLVIWSTLELKPISVYWQTLDSASIDELGAFMTRMLSELHDDSLLEDKE